ncbi:MAG: thioredoxin domain-containing protein, partial [Acidobacteriia bacterium]|nr:thioredoxin domain-containing protein [Terriglobia bacterium]
MHTNRLANEKSPYLLQHAHNPVDWYAWGPEAFEKARREDRPIFLSIGYSTCHWCHVMERESFESEQIAELLNRHFVSIKVDREERPDVDRIYMTFVQAATGGGGWPMSVWLTPDLDPFFGGTYFPPENRSGQPGFASVLRRIAEAWRSDRRQIVGSARSVVEQLQKSVAVEARSGKPVLDPGILEKGFFAFRRAFDTRLGGFGGAPKFPRPSVHNFLLRYWSRTKNQEALDMVLLTLREMAKGGMNDQLGGGFHRYSVDERWFVPHFEKMLYDQAQLAISYLEAFQITREAEFAATTRAIFDYVLRDMTDSQGGFYSAEDADSAIDPSQPQVKGEGAFYIWSAAEIRECVGQPAAEWFSYRYGAEEHGNVAHDPHQEFTGKNILYEARTLEETAAHF